MTARMNDTQRAYVALPAKEADQAKALADALAMHKLVEDQLNQHFGAPA